MKSVSKNIKFTILIPTYSRIDLLTQLVDSIVKHTDSSIYECIILDNSCGKMSPLELPKNFVWIKMDNNYGNLAVNNGVRIANNEMIIQLNDDVKILGDNWVEQLYSYFTDEKVGIVGPEISKVNIVNDTFVPGGAGVITDKYSYAESWCIMFPKRLFLNVGGMNDRIRLLYGCDFDLSMNFKRHGYRIVQAQNIPIEHLRFGTTRQKGFEYNPDKICADNLRILYNIWR